MVGQPQETQTLYAELAERLEAFEAARSFASLKGGFAKKRVGNADYWYFKIEAPIAVPIINGGATLVNVPDPARFALHKLIVSVDRPVTAQAKSGKDAQQSAEMLEILLEDRPGDIELAIDSMNRRPKGWRTKLHRGIDRLPAALDAAKKRLRGRLKA